MCLQKALPLLHQIKTCHPLSQLGLTLHEGSKFLRNNGRHLLSGLLWTKSTPVLLNQEIGQHLLLLQHGFVGMFSHNLSLRSFVLLKQTRIPMDRFRDKYRIPSARLQQWDYGWNGSYFVTINTANRKHYFGVIIDGKMHLSEIGKLADKYWLEIPDHFPFVLLGVHQIMPNHVHGIITIDKPKNNPKTTNNEKRNKNNGKGGNDDAKTRHCLELPQHYTLLNYYLQTNHSTAPHG
jgi:REP element-mobilizing transposase RayT